MKNLKHTIATTVARTPWPYLSRRAAARTLSSFFDTDAFRRLYRPGEEVTAYVAGCDGLLSMAEELGGPVILGSGKPAVFKTGLTRIDLQHRLAAMGRDRYGSCYRSEGALACALGHDRWSAQMIDVATAVSPNSPVRPEVRGIRFRLPVTLPFDDFDRQFSAALAPATVESFVGSPMGQEHCRRAGVDPEAFRRMTCYGFVASTRLSVARELMFFRPRIDGSALVAIIEAIVARHLAQLEQGQLPLLSDVVSAA